MICLAWHQWGDEHAADSGLRPLLLTEAAFAETVLQFGINPAVGITEPDLRAMSAFSTHRARMCFDFFFTSGAAGMLPVAAAPMRRPISTPCCRPNAAMTNDLAPVCRCGKGMG